MRAKAFKQGGGELKFHGTGIGSCICKSLEHGITSLSFSLVFFSLEPTCLEMSSKVLAWESDRQYVSVCVCV